MPLEWLLLSGSSGSPRHDGPVRRGRQDRYNNRQVVELDGVCVPFLNLNDLRKNKRAAERAKDLADLDELE